MKYKMFCVEYHMTRATLAGCSEIMTHRAIKVTEIVFYYLRVVFRSYHKSIIVVILQLKQFVLHYKCYDKADKRDKWLLSRTEVWMPLLAMIERIVNIQTADRQVTHKATELSSNQRGTVFLSE